MAGTFEHPKDATLMDVFLNWPGNQDDLLLELIDQDLRTHLHKAPLPVVPAEPIKDLVHWFLRGLDFLHAKLYKISTKI